MRNFIELLSRKGNYGHYWLKQSRATIWWDVKDLPEAPRLPEDTYFGVHPSRTRKSRSQRTLESDIAAINCLYADIDSKIFSGGKPAAANHIKTLPVRPTVIVDSGGGYHCYWILRDPFILDSPLKEEVAKALQSRWVAFVGGDKAVHDLARVLRVPGTLNYKYDPPRQVQVAYSNLQLLYSIDELESALPELEHREEEDDDEEEGDDLEYPAPTQPNSLTLQEVVDRAQKSSGAAKFKQLWLREESDEFESTSEADLALCCILAFWTGGDAEKIDKLFRASKRMRPKWDRDDYRRGTILRALGQVTEHYTDPAGFLTAGADDEGNAQCVAARCKGKFLYCEAFGWMHYTGDHWATELAEAAVDRQVVRVLKDRRAAAAKAEIGEDKRIEAIIRTAKPSSTNVRSCKTLLRSLISVSVGSFDESPDELNCPNGVLNLRTGELMPHNPSKRFSYVIGVPYEAQADQSVWASWLLEAVGGREDVVEYLQTAVGYSLTGRTREEAMFYIYGPARAGKGVFTETIQALLGGRPLATEVGMETFVEKRRGGDQQFDLASLKACRFVAASESKSGQWLDGSHIKRWTGGSPITCAHKYQRTFTYRPQFKIWLTSNYPLQIDPDDEAGWTRPRVIHFPHSYVDEEDKTLKERMRSPEVLQGVLAWALAGAVRWYALPKSGLQAPEIVRQETLKARAAVDWVAQWIDEEIIVTGDDNDRIPNADYYARYSDWCQTRGAAQRKLKALNDSLSRMGFDVKGKSFRYRGRTCRGWRGARLLGTSFREQITAIGEREAEAAGSEEGV